jgi:hypothetical protein
MKYPACHHSGRSTCRRPTGWQEGPRASPERSWIVPYVMAPPMIQDLFRVVGAGFSGVYAVHVCGCGQYHAECDGVVAAGYEGFVLGGS